MTRINKQKSLYLIVNNELLCVFSVNSTSKCAASLDVAAAIVAFKCDHRGPVVRFQFSGLFRDCCYYASAVRCNQAFTLNKTS